MKSNIQLLTLSATLLLSVVLVGVGCKGDMSRSSDAKSSDAGAPSMGSERTAYDRTVVTNANANADNSKQNVRDRNDATLTPGDQGTTESDRNITQQVRKSLVSNDNGYSVTAQNVKIITVNGKVTLRGPVKTDAEKTGIVSLAKNIAGQDNVEDQLEVKANP